MWSVVALRSGRAGPFFVVERGGSWSDYGVGGMMRGLGRFFWT